MFTCAQIKLDDKKLTHLLNMVMSRAEKLETKQDKIEAEFLIAIDSYQLDSLDLAKMRRLTQFKQNQMLHIIYNTTLAFENAIALQTPNGIRRFAELKAMVQE